MQGYKSVEEYYKGIKVAMIKANVKKDREAIMAQFFHGLNCEIHDIIKLQHCINLDNMVYVAMLVEK